MDEKRKRGRPKKVIEESISLDKDDPNKTKKKRGRRKKSEIAMYQLPLTITNNSREESNYIVMLDIKYSDLDTTVGVIKNDKLICDDLIDSFAQLIQQRRSLYESDLTLKSIHDRILSSEETTTNFYSSYDRKEINMTVLPIFQLNGEGWPSYSSYSCWNCDCQFDAPPIGVPEHINNNQFYCSGNFCSFACAGRYIIDTDHTINRFEKLSLLNTLYQLTFDLKVTDYVKIASPKQVLHKYGGCLSYSQYHDPKISQKVEIYKLPIIPLYYYICNDNSNELPIDELSKEVVTMGDSKTI